MKVLSMFYGIIIRMEYNPNTVPQIQAEYYDHTATFDLAEGNLISGTMPDDQALFIGAWIDIHHAELMANWKLEKEGEALYQIAPLQ